MNIINTIGNDMLINYIYNKIVYNIKTNIIKDFFINLGKSEEKDIKVIETPTGYLVGLEILFSINEETNILNINLLNRINILVRDYIVNNEQPTIEIINKILKDKGSDCIIEEIEVGYINKEYFIKFLVKLNFIEYSSIMILH